MAKMVELKYRGRSDSRVLRKEDLVSMGLPSESDYSQTTFNAGEPTKVSSEVATILLDHDLVKGEFEKHEEPKAPESIPADVAPAVKK